MQDASAARAATPTPRPCWLRYFNCNPPSVSWPPIIRKDNMSKRSSSSGVLPALLATVGALGCASAVDEPTSEAEQRVQAPAVGLALEVDNGAGVPLQLQRGRTYYLNQID